MKSGKRYQEIKKAGSRQPCLLKLTDETLNFAVFDFN
jgi:hypothetical protein